MLKGLHTSQAGMTLHCLTCPETQPSTSDHVVLTWKSSRSFCACFSRLSTSQRICNAPFCAASRSALSVSSARANFSRTCAKSHVSFTFKSTQNHNGSRCTTIQWVDALTSSRSARLDASSLSRESSCPTLSLSAACSSWIFL